jgi:hypothetical protein
MPLFKPRDKGIKYVREYNSKNQVAKNPPVKEHRQYQYYGKKQVKNKPT